MNNNPFLKKVIIGIALSIVCISVGYYFVYRYLKQTNEHISILQQKRLAETSEREYTESAKSLLEEVRPEISRISLSILPRDGDVAFIEKLEALARTQKIDISISSLSIDTDETLAKSGIVIFNIKAKTTGTWADMYTFISKLELLPEEIQVRRLNMSGTIDDGTTTKGPRPWNGLFEIRVLKYQ